MSYIRLNIPCQTCTHLFRPVGDPKMCNAYPDGIPERLMNNFSWKHNKVESDQVGNYVYKKAKRKES
jgi:hypothetical protein